MRLVNPAYDFEVGYRPKADIILAGRGDFITG
jgi:hypothetical protein